MEVLLHTKVLGPYNFRSFLRTIETIFEIRGTNYYFVSDKAFEKSRKEPEVAEISQYEK